MKTSSTFLLTASITLFSRLAAGQALDPAVLNKPLGESWPTYSGDYSGKRYSSLTQINQSNVKNLTLSWVGKVIPGLGGGGGGRGGFGPGGPAVIVGGEGTGEAGVGNEKRGRKPRPRPPGHSRTARHGSPRVARETSRRFDPLLSLR